MNRRRTLGFLVVVTCWLFLPAGSAEATYPGTNGEIVFLRASELRAIDADGANDRSYSSLSSAEALSFSSDGTEAVIADFIKTGARISLLDLATDTRTVVLKPRNAPTDEVFSVALSPDSSSIVFCDGFPGNLWTIATDGSALTKLPSKGYCYADWGVDGRIVASKGVFHGDGDRIVTTMDGDGRHKDVIATLPPARQRWRIVYVLRPTWSPDGSTVVFPAQRKHVKPDIWSVGSEGTDLHRLTRTRTTSEYGPVFSPDGLSIVFARRDAGSPNVDLWTMDPSGGNAAVLLSTPSDSEYPLAWRPT